MMESEYVKSLVATLNYLHSQNITYVYLNEYSSQVSAARESTIMGSRYLNAFATKPLNGQLTYDKIIWIDSDISWTPEQFMQLYESKYDIVSGLYYNEEHTPVFAFNEEDIYFDHESLKHKQYPFEIFGAGFGFIAIKSGVFERISRPWFDAVFQKIENEDKTKEIFVPWGEDLSWCKKAREQGFKIYLDPSIKVYHHKKIALGG